MGFSLRAETTSSLWKGKCDCNTNLQIGIAKTRNWLSIVCIKAIKSKRVKLDTTQLLPPIISILCSLTKSSNLPYCMTLPLTRHQPGNELVWQAICCKIDSPDGSYCFFSSLFRVFSLWPVKLGSGAFWLIQISISNTSQKQRKAEERKIRALLEK